MWNNYNAKFHQNPVKESRVIKLRRIPPCTESLRLDRAKVAEAGMFKTRYGLNAFIDIVLQKPPNFERT